MAGKYASASVMIRLLIPEKSVANHPAAVHPTGEFPPASGDARFPSVEGWQAKPDGVVGAGQVP
jgi:hypothetical protein